MNMTRKRSTLIGLSALALAGGAVALHAQGPAPQVPGAADPARVTAGTYTIDPNHTQVLFGYDHFGFTDNMGLLSMPTGTLTLDPKNPGAAKVTIDLPIANIRTGIPKFDEHLMSADFFEAAAHPTARFVSTSVKVDGTSADIMGTLTIKGMSKPVTIDATFKGAGVNPMNKKETVGFSGTAVINRSDFGLGKYAPMVSDRVELKIVAAFEKQ